MSHPFDTVATVDAPGDDLDEFIKGNPAYYDWLTRTIEAATREPVPWVAVELAIMLDRLIRAHEAEESGGPMCAECAAKEEGPTS